MERLFDEKFQKKIEYLSFVARRLHRAKVIRRRRRKRIGSGLEFADRRGYEIGDDLRYIDWNCYARMERLLLRLFEEEEEWRVYFLLDVSESMRLGEPRKIDYARLLCVALAFIALGNMDKVGFWLFSDKIEGRLPLAKGKPKIFAIMKFLESASAGGRTDCASSFSQFLPEAERPGVAVIASDFLDYKGAEKGLKLLAYNRFSPFLLHIIDGQERVPAYLSDVKLIDSETAKSHNVTVTPQVRNAYIAEFEKFEQELEQTCVDIDAIRIPADTAVPFEKLVLSALARGEFVK
jgi:uncharacterized protein (DUF58 family)